MFTNTQHAMRQLPRRNPRYDLNASLQMVFGSQTNLERPPHILSQHPGKMSLTMLKDPPSFYIVHIQLRRWHLQFWILRNGLILGHCLFFQNLCVWSTTTPSCSMTEDSLGDGSIGAQNSSKREELAFGTCRGSTVEGGQTTPTDGSIGARIFPTREDLPLILVDDRPKHPHPWKKNLARMLDDSSPAPSND